jgi:hypothetical protein
MIPCTTISRAAFAASTCERLLGDLVDAGFLACTPLGMFVRADSGRAGA